LVKKTRYNFLSYNASKFLGLSLFFYILSCGILKGQDIIFDQYYQTPVLSNIALSGLDTTMNTSFHYRQQPLSTGESYATSIFSFTYPLFKKTKPKAETWSAISINIISDNFTDFSQNLGGLIAFTYNQPLTEKIIASFAMQGGLFQQSLNLNNITTDNQFLTGVYDPNASLNETFNNTNSSYFLISSSLLLHWKNPYRSIPEKFIGISYNNFNEPSRNFLEINNDKIPSNITLTAGLEFNIGHRMSLMPNLRATYRLEKAYGMFGTWFYYDLSLMPQDGYLGIGTWYNNNQSLAFALEVMQKKFNVTFSYNLPMSSQSTVWQGAGSVELSLGVRINRKRKIKIPVETDSIPKKDTLITAEIPTDTLLIAQNDKIFSVMIQKFDSEFGKEDSIVVDTIKIEKIDKFVKNNPEEKPVIDTFFVDAAVDYENRYIFFDANSSEISIENQNPIFEVMAILINDSNIRVALKGYANEGEESIKFAQYRSEEVKEFLISQGIEADKIEILKPDKKPPNLINNTEEKQKIRRVDCVFFYEDEGK